MRVRFLCLLSQFRGSLPKGTRDHRRVTEQGSNPVYLYEGDSGLPLFFLISKISLSQEGHKDKIYSFINNFRVINILPINMIFGLLTLLVPFQLFQKMSFLLFVILQQVLNNDNDALIVVNPYQFECL